MIFEQLEIHFKFGPHEAFFKIYESRFGQIGLFGGLKPSLTQLPHGGEIFT